MKPTYVNYLWMATRHLEKRALEEEGIASDWVKRHRAKEQNIAHAAFAIRAKALEDPEKVQAAIEAFAALSASTQSNDKEGGTE